jgi:hypothetical protein
MRHCVILSTTLALSLVSWDMAAQVPKGSSPPTYGQTVFAHYDARFVRQSQLIFTLLVPRDSLQSLLPAGYSLPPGNTASLSTNFILQQREQLPAAISGLAAGTYGPASALIIQAEVVDADGDYEQVQLDNERSTDDSVRLINSLWGEGSARKASTLVIDLKEVTPEEDEDAARGGTTKAPFIRFSGRIENEAIGLVLGVDATVPADVTTAVRNTLQRGPDGHPELFRFINGAMHPPVPNGASMNVINDDRVAVPSAGHLSIHVRDRELRLPEGTLPVLGVGPTVTLLRNRETFQVKCTPATCP